MGLFTHLQLASNWKINCRFTPTSLTNENLSTSGYRQWGVCIAVCGNVYGVCSGKERNCVLARSGGKVA